ncbi:hypothetical protein N0V90_013191 [Kalmusia sp. IMI 367209]|nr:hypothetical protein N0V90_013191 [Kalmusia sp. IMI 367209]
MTTPDTTSGRKRSFSYVTDTPPAKVHQIYPPSFYDNLSRVWLTDLALIEHNRRLEHTDHLPTPPPPPSIQEPLLDELSSFDLTEIQRFARHGGPDLADIRGYHIYNMPRAARTQEQDVAAANDPVIATTTSKKTSSPYDRNFMQTLIDNGVCPPDYEYPGNIQPAQAVDYEQVKEHLLKERNDKDLTKLNKSDVKAMSKSLNRTSEGTVSDWIFPKLEGTLVSAREREGRLPFVKLKPLFRNVRLAIPVPDVFYGAVPEQIRLPIREQLSKSIQPTADTDNPILPNCFLAVKGKDGAVAVAERQAYYDGVIGARTIHDLEEYAAGKSIFDKKIKSISMTLINGTLTMYGTHVLGPSLREHPEVRYVVTKINRFVLDNDVFELHRAITAYRNALEWAEEIRDDAIQKAHRRLDAVTKQGRQPRAPESKQQIRTKGSRTGLRSGGFESHVAL